MKTIDFNTLQEKISENQKSFILLNALEPSYIRRFQIPNSLNITRKEEIVQSLDKEDEIVVYCSDTVCNESSTMYHMLEDMGYKNVSRYAGGLTEWYENGQALEEITTSNAA